MPRLLRWMTLATLRCIVQSGSANDPVAFKKLLEICPAAADVKNKKGDQPAYLFCRHVDFNDPESQDLFDTVIATCSPSTDPLELFDILLECSLINKKGVWAVKRVLDVYSESNISQDACIFVCERISDPAIQTTPPLQKSSSDRSASTLAKLRALRVSKWLMRYTMRLRAGRWL
jgi:hypothetical protein